MEQISKIAARIDSLLELHDLIRALRSMAATNARAAQDALEGTESYRAIVEEAIGDALAIGANLPTSPGADRQGRRMLVAVCSEQGFVGLLNDRILEAVAGRRAPNEDLLIVGRRGALRAEELDMPVARQLSMTEHAPGITALARSVCDTIGAAGTVRITYARHGVGGTPTVATRDVLPIDPEMIARSQQRSPPLHHLPPDRLMAHLEREYLFAEIANILMESLGSENGARLRAMDAADKNISDKLDGLHRQEQTLRQAEITEEILEVVTGAEALAGSRR